MKLESNPYELIIIGAGINGAAIAREAALSGLKVLLLEQDDIGSGTSAASTRLIHGGLRYLEHGELSLVYESLAERERLLRYASHLVVPLGLYLPVYAHGYRKRWQIRAGMCLYDVLSTGKSLPSHTMLSRTALLERLPSLSQDGLVGGAHYFDAQVPFAERLVLENVQDAVANGAKLLTHCRVTEIQVERGQVRGVKWQHRDGRTAHASAGTLVNAAGPWVDGVLGEISSKRLIGGTKGSHVVLSGFPGAPESAIYTEAASDGRPFFIIPWNGLYLIGTTDERYEDDPGAARITQREVDYLLSETETVIAPARELAKFVCYSYSGIRPLPYQSHGQTGAITRRHLIRSHRRARGLYSVIGGKLTTHRALAEDVMRRLRRRFPKQGRRSPTRNRYLPAALPTDERDEMMSEIGSRLGVGQADRLWRIYGAGAARIVEDAAAASDLAMVVAPQSHVMVAELVHAIEAEWAITLTDILQRRCMVGLDADFGLKTAPAAAQWLVRLGIWDHARAEQELADYRNYARQRAI